MNASSVDSSSLPDLQPEQFVGHISPEDRPAILERSTSLFKSYANAARQGAAGNEAQNLEKARYWRRVAELLTGQP